MISQSLFQSQPSHPQGQPQYYMAKNSNSSPPVLANPSPFTQQSQNWVIIHKLHIILLLIPNNLMEAISTPTDANVFLGNGQGLLVHIFGFATFSSHTYLMSPFI